jgi:hypothetical protein
LIFFFYYSINFDVHAELSVKKHAPPAQSPQKLTPPFKKFNKLAAEPTQNRNAAFSKIEKPKATLLLAYSFKLPVNFFANGYKFFNSPKPLINDDDLTPQENKDKSKEQKIDDPKKSQ